MEDRVSQLASDLMKGEQDFCSCDRCQLDVIAITLNKVQPKYVVTKTGELYGRANMKTNQTDTDIIQEIMRAIEIVRENPRHDE